MTIEDYKAQLKMRIEILKNKRDSFPFTASYHRYVGEIFALERVLQDLDMLELQSIPKEEPQY